jgi:enamine deaminase RidA (YjgF/YER057c/UK114 family)
MKGDVRTMVDGADRSVTGVVDGGGFYFARTASAARFVFMAGPAVDATGRVADAARVPPPYQLSPSAHVRAQTRYIWNEFVRGLAEVGSSVRDVVQVEQYIQHKVHADGYLEVSRGPGLLVSDRPGSALIETGDFTPPDVVVSPTGIAIVPGPDFVKEITSSGLQYGIPMPHLGGIYSVQRDRPGGPLCLHHSLGVGLRHRYPPRREGGPVGLVGKRGP